MATGPGIMAWLAVLAAVGVGLLAVALTPDAKTQWSLLAVAVAVVPMIPTTMLLSLQRGPKPVFDLWQVAITASMVRSLTSVSAAGAVLWLTEAPMNPFIWVFLLVAGVALVSEKLIVLGTSHVVMSPSQA